jgi:hypothetical protein
MAVSFQMFLVFPKTIGEKNTRIIGILPQFEMPAALESADIHFSFLEQAPGKSGICSVLKVSFTMRLSMRMVLGVNEINVYGIVYF